jgi:hypothetical protein
VTFEASVHFVGFFIWCSKSLKPETDELREKLCVWFQRRINIFQRSHSPEKNFVPFIAQLTKQGILKMEETSSFFFRVCAESRETYNIRIQYPDLFARCEAAVVRFGTPHLFNFVELNKNLVNFPHGLLNEPRYQICTVLERFKK